MKPLVDKENKKKNHNTKVNGKIQQLCHFTGIFDEDIDFSCRYTKNMRTCVMWSVRVCVCATITCVECSYACACAYILTIDFR